MTTLRMTYGSDSVMVTIGSDPSSPILVDGAEIGAQFGDGSCRIEPSMRIAARACWGTVYETEADAVAAGADVASSECCLWDDVAYEAQS